MDKLCFGLSIYSLLAGVSYLIIPGRHPETIFYLLAFAVFALISTRRKDDQ